MGGEIEEGLRLRERLRLRATLWGYFIRACVRRQCLQAFFEVVSVRSSVRSRAVRAESVSPGKRESRPWGSGPVPPSQGPSALWILEVRPVPPGVPTRPSRPRPIRGGVMEGGTEPLVRSDRGGLAGNCGHDANPVLLQTWKCEPCYGLTPFMGDTFSGQPAMPNPNS